MPTFNSGVLFSTRCKLDIMSEWTMTYGNESGHVRKHLWMRCLLVIFGTGLYGVIECCLEAAISILLSTEYTGRQQRAEYDSSSDTPNWKRREVKELQWAGAVQAKHRSKRGKEQSNLGSWKRQLPIIMTSFALSAFRSLRC
ncbi:hypothetical protein L228DRAFT_37738 [Xylona heveae TC161]|uniref:Uncharacterized protein n=1 Tax=Xylona heveae (strain CBS 132557 / TC161) TaxID=1328760 RepID=A0A164ZX51_XYLHT|nr:hypothetical protein L228DRAFT_37738 [Xylona heveae TC161]KZF19647.1 hypothetical protein L228DRAFT_37738 [Xylona heveae TC161]